MSSKAAAWAALFLSMFALAYGQDSCEYTYDGGAGAIDLTALGNQNYQAMQPGNSSLYFRPCNTG